jgi:DNA adenine methylase
MQGVAEEVRPTRQAFGSPGGKSYLAPKIVDMMPEHETYIESFAGGAAVYFKKPPSEKEVLSDKDREIAFAFRFLRDMTPEQYERLKRKNWTISIEQFEKLKGVIPKDDIERFYKFYYLKKASYGDASKQINPLRLIEGHNHLDVSHLWRVHERLKKTAIHGGDALAMMRKYDNANAFFYLDPPYPDRAFIGQKAEDKYTTEDLAKLVERLKGIKGKFALSLGTEHAKLLPNDWHVKKVKVWRRIPRGVGDFNQTYGYEIIATNYPPPDTTRHALRTPLVRPPKIIRWASKKAVGRRSRPRRKSRVRKAYVPPTVSLAGMGG